MSDIPGTTRDAIDTAARLERRSHPAHRHGRPASARQGRLRGRPPSASRRCAPSGPSSGPTSPSCVIDAADGLTAQDAHVAGLGRRRGRGLVVAINKWDLVERRPTGPSTSSPPGSGPRSRSSTSRPSSPSAPRPASASAGSWSRRWRSSRRAPQAHPDRRAQPDPRRSRLRQPPPPVKGRRPKFFYATQAAVEPPTFVLFGSDAARVHFSYRRYLENRLRDAFGFDGTPIRLVFRDRRRVELERHAEAAQRQRQGARVRRQGRQGHEQGPRSHGEARDAEHAAMTRPQRSAGRRRRAWGTTLALHLARHGPVTLLAR